MIGDQLDIAGRIRALLPKSWFPKVSPVLDATNQGAAWALSNVYAQITYASLQTRIQTATDGWLDIISGDFFGVNLPRLPSELDASFRARILANLFVQGPTRADMIAVLTLITGRAPLVFEPSNTADTLGWDGSAGWDIAGGWGDALPYQCFVTAYRPLGGGAQPLGYWDTYLVAWDAYGAWSESGTLPDSIIIAAVEATKPAGTIVWMRIENNPVSP